MGMGHAGSAEGSSKDISPIFTTLQQPVFLVSVSPNDRINYLPVPLYFDFSSTRWTSREKRARHSLFLMQTPNGAIVRDARLSLFH